MISAKLVTLGPLKLNYFEIKVIIFIQVSPTKLYHVTQIVVNAVM